VATAFILRFAENAMGDVEAQPASMTSPSDASRLAIVNGTQTLTNVSTEAADLDPRKASLTVVPTT
jgi:hypothetical protein